MKANTPKAWDRLPKSERDRITEYCREVASRAIDEEEAELQIVWMKLCCIILHEAFGFGERRLYTFLGNWKRMYRRNAHLRTRAEQTKYLDGKMADIFKKSGFPAQFVEGLKEL